MKIYEFTKKELDYFREWCNFTKDELELFERRSRSETIEYIAEQMNVSVSTAKRISRRVNVKIIKVC